MESKPKRITLVEEMETEELNEGIEKLAFDLDAKFGKSWEIWRTATCQWCFRGILHQQVCEHRVNGLATCLRQAMHWEPLPIVPRQPQLYGMNLFKPYRDGSYWRLFYDRTDCCVRFKTRTEAMAYAKKACENSVKGRDAWIKEHGWTIDKKEGEDFRYDY